MIYRKQKDTGVQFIFILRVQNYRRMMKLTVAGSKYVHMSRLTDQNVLDVKFVNLRQTPMVVTVNWMVCLEANANDVEYWL